MRKRIKELAENCIKELLDPFYQAATGEIAFFLFLSMLPMITLIAQLLGVFSLSLESIHEWLMLEFNTINIEPFFEAIPSENLSPEGNFALVCVTIWSASKLQHALTNLTDYINNDYEQIDKGYIKRRARSFLIILVIIVVFVLALVFLVYFPLLVHMAFGSSRLTSIFESMYLSARWVVVMAFYFLTVLMVYMITPYHPVKAEKVLPGAILSSVGFVVVTIVYSVLFRFSSSNIVYGSMAQVVALMIWFWLIAWVMCLGIVLNKNVNIIKESRSPEAIPTRAEDIA